MFREYHCLFIGTSMTDDNVRRLLFYSKSERDRSRAHEERGIEKEPRHFVILCNRDMSSRLRDFTDTTLAALSVRPLWVDHFKYSAGEKRMIVFQTEVASCLYRSAVAFKSSLLDAPRERVSVKKKTSARVRNLLQDFLI
jgi:hypothetical protein